jgi:SAM-dependent methyltransferase
VQLDKYRAANRDNWDDRVPIHWASEDYNVAEFIRNPDYVSGAIRIDRSTVELGDVSGKSLLHLQCHIGHDTLSWARSGATVTGVDFSEPSIDAARRLSEESGTAGDFVVAELYDSPRVLAGRQFDIVYTGLGAICWLPDIAEWAKVVAQFLKPGGTFYILEGHPMMWSVSQDVEQPDDALIFNWPYFESAGPMGEDEESSYAGTGNIAHPRSYNFTHGLGETTTALINAGLQIEFVHEHKISHCKAFSLLEPADDDMWKMPNGREDYLPLSMSIRATKPR